MLHEFTLILPHASTEARYGRDLGAACRMGAALGGKVGMAALRIEGAGRLVP
jgi:hypothetical protein